MHDIYLDNSATTLVLPQVADVMREMLLENYGNPSSQHSRGVQAEKVKTNARRLLAQACGIKEQELFFTSGGTEANNLAIKGTARRLKRRGLHLVTTQVEHPSVLYAFRALAAEGFEVTYVPVDRNGFVTVADVLAAIRTDTLLVSVMHVNNEVGTVMPIASIGQAIKAKYPHILFHVDAVQSFGKLPVPAKIWQADLLTLSAHKLHGPKGCGALYRKDSLSLEPLFHGGDQEFGLRPGTENMAGIAGFAEAARLALEFQEPQQRHIAKLKKMFVEEIRTGIADTVVNSPEDAAPHIVNITFADVKGEVLVHALAEHGIYVSTGSACHSHRAEPSHVLLAMGRSGQEIASSIRFSFSAKNKETQLLYTLEKLCAAVETLRSMTRRK